MRIFVSQPMTGREEKEVIDERNKVIDYMTSKYIEDIDLVENYYKDGGPTRDYKYQSLWFLGDSIMLMGKADIVVFVPGYENAKGCKVEMEICKLYGIPFKVLNEGDI